MNTTTALPPSRLRRKPRDIAAVCCMLVLPLLGGCLGGISKPGARAVYAMPAVENAPQGPSRWRQSLQVETPSALPPLSSADMLVLTDQGEVQVLADARWSAPAPLLLQDLLVRQLDASQQLHSVASGPQSWAQALRLVTELRSLELRPTGTGLQAHIELNVRLVCSRDARLIASHADLQAQSGVLTTAQAPGGLREVAAAASLKISQWLQSLPEPACN